MATLIRPSPVKVIGNDRDPDWVCCRCGRPLGLRPQIIQGEGLVCERWCR